MKKKSNLVRLLLSFSVFSVLLLSCSKEPCTIYGTITYEGRPCSDVLITVDDRVSTTTDINGNYEMEIEVYPDGLNNYDNRQHVMMKIYTSGYASRFASKEHEISFGKRMRVDFDWASDIYYWNYYDALVSR